MNEYESIYQLAVNWILWFVLGTTAAYGFFTLLEYINGRENKD